MSIPMDSVGAAEALAKAIANGPAPPGAYDNKGGFDSYSQHAQKDYALEVNGVVVGYQGHVPRARDTVGTCPIGKVPGTPVSPTGKRWRGSQLHPPKYAASQRGEWSLKTLQQ